MQIYFACVLLLIVFAGLVFGTDVSGKYMWTMPRKSFTQLHMTAIFLQVYNTMLRQPTKGKFLAELFVAFKARNNYFSTTIHVLVSATVKL